MLFWPSRMDLAPTLTCMPLQPQTGDELYCTALPGASRIILLPSISISV
jgi:hypothetical protein